MSASHRVPPEIWEMIGTHLSRYQLRTWLFLSPMHRQIAMRFIFRTLDFYIFEELDDFKRNMEILEQLILDSTFARNVRLLRIHWGDEQKRNFRLLNSGCLVFLCGGPPLRS